MLYIKTIFSQDRKRLILTFFSFFIATIALIFSMIYMSSIKNTVSNDIYLKENEFHVFVDERRFENIPVNYYEKLKESFNFVSPTVYSDIEFNAKHFTIIGTELKLEKFIFDSNVYGFKLNSNLNLDDKLPPIYVKSNFENVQLGDVIWLGSNQFYVAGLINYNEETLNDPIFLIDLDSYGKYIDDSIVNSKSGITKYIINEYLIIDNNKDKNHKLEIENIYNDSVEYSLNTYEKILNKEMSDFFIIEYISLFIYILIGVFSFVNIFIAINLIIVERKKFYSILQVLGMKISDMRKMLVTEMTILSLISTIISIIVGLISSFLIIQYVLKINVSLPKINELLMVFIITLIVPIILTFISTLFIKDRHIEK